MFHINVFIPDRHHDTITGVSAQAGLTKSEFVRRLFDYSLRADRLNEIIPAMSGKLLKGDGR